MVAMTQVQINHCGDFGSLVYAQQVLSGEIHPYVRRQLKDALVEFGHVRILRRLDEVNHFFLEIEVTQLIQREQRSFVIWRDRRIDAP